MYEPLPVPSKLSLGEFSTGLTIHWPVAINTY